MDQIKDNPKDQPKDNPKLTKDKTKDQPTKTKYLLFKCGPTGSGKSIIES